MGPDGRVWSRFTTTIVYPTLITNGVAEPSDRAGLALVCKYVDEEATAYP